MSILLLDTNIVSYLMKAHPIAQRYRPHLEGNTLAISFMTVGELYEGAFRANWDEPKCQWLQETLKDYLVVPSNPGICVRWGEVRSLRRSQPISAEDAWIAATALEYGCALVTHNARDFRDIPSLTIITENK